MFVGSYRYTVDTKGRVNCPRSYLDPFQAGQRKFFFATKGLDQCLFLYPPDGWQAVVAEVRANSLGSEEARAFSRKFFGSTRELEVDGASRILLPKELREYAAIKDEALFVGVDTRIELWAPPRFDAHEAEHATRYEEHAKGIFRA